MTRKAVNFTTIVGLLGAIAVSPVQSQGEESDVGAEVRSLLAAGWKPSLKGLKDAEEHCGKAKALSPSDVRIPFAMALVYLQNRKYNDSVRQLDAALAGGKALLPIRRTRIYVAVLMKDQAAADREVQALATRLSGPELSGDAELSYQESARFLGNVVEFIAIQKGPESTTASTLDAHLKDSLSGKRADAYAAGRAETAERAKSLELELEKTKAEALVQDQAKQGEAQKKLDAKMAPLRALAQDVAAREKAYREAHAAAVAVHEPKARADLARLSKLESDARGLKSEIRSLEKKIDRAERTDDDDDKGKKADTKDEEREIRRLENKLDTIDSEIDRIELNPSVGIMRKYNDDLQKFLLEMRPVQFQLAQFGDAQAAIAKMRIDESNSTTSALAAKMKAFTSYVEFSLDAERDRILGTYRSK